MPKTPRKSFQAELERGNSRLNWVIVRIPFDVARVWGARGQLKVRGEINGFGFRTSLFPTGQGGHVLLVNKRMQSGGNVRVGMTARFGMEPDKQERKIIVPAELARALAEDQALVRWFEQLNYSTRKFATDWISGVKSAEARERRAGQLAERLMAAMEAERDLPPILRLAFARNPQAQEGWNRMSAARRRGHLLGIFYYQTPAAQARRVARAVHDAFEVAEKFKRLGRSRMPSSGRTDAC